MSSEFQDFPAKLEAVHLMLGIVGPSGAGKTYSALELATGIVRVDPGEIFLVDSNNRRALRYAPPRFNFRHVPFEPPYSPERYQKAAEYCVSRGAKVVIFDSASDEHDGIGGVLENQERICSELAAKWKCSREKADQAAWNYAKTPRKKFRHAVTHMDAHFIFTYRGKEKKDLNKRDPDIGWQPIGDEGMIYELEAKFLLLPGADGVPTLMPDTVAEKKLVKTPEYFRDLFKERVRLSADIGEKMARWAASGEQAPKPSPTSPHPLITRAQECPDLDTLAAIKAEGKAAWRTLTMIDQKALAQAIEQAEARITCALMADEAEEVVA